MPGPAAIVWLLPACEGISFVADQVGLLIVTFVVAFLHGGYMV